MINIAVTGTPKNTPTAAAAKDAPASQKKQTGAARKLNF